MKKLFFTLVVLSISLKSFSQLNPIQNLYWHHWYSTPNNFYTLQWSPPIPSLTDTLVGYNIYRNNQLYRFFTGTTINHSLPQDTVFGGEAFLDYPLEPFYIHVTAVYNKNHLQSIYNDSAICYGIAIGIDNITNTESFTLSPNPFSKSTQITLNQTYQNIALAVYDIQGKLVAQQHYANCSQIQLHRNQLTNGLHFVKLTLDDYTVETFKVVVGE